MCAYTLTSFLQLFSCPQSHFLYHHPLPLLNQFSAPSRLFLSFCLWYPLRLIRATYLHMDILSVATLKKTTLFPQESLSALITAGRKRASQGLFWLPLTEAKGPVLCKSQAGFRTFMWPYQKKVFCRLYPFCHPRVSSRPLPLL